MVNLSNMKIFTTLFIIINLSLNGVAQEVSFWGDAMINSSIPEHRILALDKFKTSFEAELLKESSFNNQFSDLPWISIQYPEDRSFRIISWQVDKGDFQYEYHGYFQNDKRLIPFNTQSGMDALEDDIVLSLKDWSGALVYRVLQVDNTYMLWTYRMLDNYTKVKTCEPILITDGEVQLGAAIFQEKEASAEYFARHILQYSADMSATLDYYQETKRLIFDNLIMMAGRMEGQGITYVADGSYRGYDFINGKWMAKDKLFDQISARPPREKRVSNNKDLFGRKGQ